MTISGTKNTLAFTLVEVVIAMGIMAFGVVVILGLLSVVLQIHRESKGNMLAADAASHIIALRQVSPTNTIAGVLLPPINQAWGASQGAGYISGDGAPTNAAAADFYATYQVGTNAGTGLRAGNVDIMLSWPAAGAAHAQNHYEVFTTVSW